MPEFQPGWAVVRREWTRIEGEDADVVTVLRVYSYEAQALAEVQRLINESEGQDCVHYVEATQVEHPWQMGRAERVE